MLLRHTKPKRILVLLTVNMTTTRISLSFLELECLLIADIRKNTMSFCT